MVSYKRVTYLEYSAPKPTATVIVAIVVPSSAWPTELTSSPSSKK